MQRRAISFAWMAAKLRANLRVCTERAGVLHVSAQIRPKRMSALIIWGFR